ncbi:MAG: hypothetical protein IPP71_17005 [Bacteroidetes bacterium]|nr:hypothetical protein [Bacteroidota bacterium]
MAQVALVQPGKKEEASDFTNAVVIKKKPADQIGSAATKSEESLLLIRQL